MTQKEMILRYMKQFGSITPAEAYEDIGCMRLAARIADLEADNVAIKKEMVKKKNRFGKTVRFKRYSLA